MPTDTLPAAISVAAPTDDSLVRDLLYTDRPGVQLTNVATGVVPPYSATDGERLAIDKFVTDVLPASGTFADPLLAGESLQIDIGAFPSGGALDLSIWGINADGTRFPLPHFKQLTLSPMANDVGSVSLEYPVTGNNFDLLKAIQVGQKDMEIAIWLFGRETGSLRAVLQDAQGDEVGEDAVWTFSGTFLEGRMNEAIVFPNSADPSGKFESIFNASTPGTIMRTLMAQANSRGALADISYTSFTDTKDSRGVAWANSITIKFGPGATYKSVLDSLVGYGVCEWEITSKHELRLYNSGARGVDLTLLNPPVVLYKGRNLTDGPRKYSVRDAATTLLAAGKDAIYYNQTDASALARRGRRIEKMAQAGNNLDDLASLTAFVQADLPAVTAGSMELTHGLVFGAGYPLPAFGFNVGDWIWSDCTGVKERLRILQWTMTVGENGTTGSVTLNDYFRDHLAKLALKLTAIADGVIVAGTSTPSPAEDTIAPAAPQNVSATSLAFYDDTNHTYAIGQAAWDPVLLNADGSACNDLSVYQIRYRTGVPGNTVWSLAPTTSTNAGTFGPLTPNVSCEIQVKAVDYNGHSSAWSDSYFFTTDYDLNPPPVPSSPVMTNFMGVLRIFWDGKGSVGENMPVDFDHIEVHISQSAGFAPDDTTLFDVMYGTGTDIYTTNNYDVGYYARFISVDQNGNKSAPSGTGMATPGQVASQDIFAGAVGSLQLAELAVKNANIDLLAVNNANVGDLSVGKLTGGILTADVLIAGIMRTAFVGARTEIDSAGVRLYGSDGTKTVDLKSSDGSALITGQYQTAMTGERLVINAALGAADEMRVYPSGAGDYARINARTATDGSAAILIDGGATGVTSRGRLGAYKSEGFVSCVNNDAGGDTTAGYSLTAVSCNSTSINTWCQSKFFWSKYSGSSFVSNSNLWLMWATGGISNCPVFGATVQDSGIKFDDGNTAATNAIGTLFGPFKCSALTQTSTEVEKTQIKSIRQVMTPLDVIKSAPSRAWKYIHEVDAKGTKAPQRFGPVAETLPQELIWMTPKADGSGLEPSIDHGSMIGTLWGAICQLEARRITSTTAMCSVPGGTVLRSGDTVEVAASWESSPLAVPTDAIVFLNAGLLGAGKVTAWVKPGSITSTGCTVVFKNISSGNVVSAATAMAGLTSVTATVVGQALYTPDVDF